MSLLPPPIAFPFLAFPEKDRKSPPNTPFFKLVHLFIRPDFPVGGRCHRHLSVRPLWASGKFDLFTLREIYVDMFAFGKLDIWPDGHSICGPIVPLDMCHNVARIGQTTSIKDGMSVPNYFCSQRRLSHLAFNLVVTMADMRRHRTQSKIYGE